MAGYFTCVIQVYSIHSFLLLIMTGLQCIFIFVLVSRFALRLIYTLSQKAVALLDFQTTGPTSIIILVQRMIIELIT